MTAGVIHFDSMHFQGAQVLAARIKAYWIKRGYLGVQTSLVKVDPPPSLSHNAKPIYCVRSNMVRGFPPKA